MIGQRRWLLVATVLLMTIASATGCNLSSSPKKAPGSEPLKEGQTIGKIERLPGGTAVASEVITLLGVSCTDGQVVVNTNLQRITGKMDCAQEIPQSTLERFYGQSVTVSYAKSRLRIDSVSAGTFELPVTDATISQINAAP